MKTQSLLVAATLFVTVGVASAQNEPSQDTMRAPTGVDTEQSAHWDRSGGCYGRPSRACAKKPQVKLLTCPRGWVLKWTVQATRKPRLTESKSDKR
jgi:hypothetical protein